MAEKLCFQPANVGAHVRSGRRQSMPSRSINTCADVSATVHVAVTGQTKRPRSIRFENRQSP